MEPPLRNESEEIWGHSPTIEVRVKALARDSHRWVGAKVRIYLDGKLVGQADTNADGHATCQIPKPTAEQRIEIDVTSAAVDQAMQTRRYYGWDWIAPGTIVGPNPGRIETEVFLKPWVP